MTTIEHRIAPPKCYICGKEKATEMGKMRVMVMPDRVFPYNFGLCHECAAKAEKLWQTGATRLFGVEIDSVLSFEVVHMEEGWRDSDFKDLVLGRMLG